MRSLNSAAFFCLRKSLLMSQFKTSMTRQDRCRTHLKHKPSYHPPPSSTHNVLPAADDPTSVEYTGLSTAAIGALRVEGTASFTLHFGRLHALTVCISYFRMIFPSRCRAARGPEGSASAHCLLFIFVIHIRGTKFAWSLIVVLQRGTGKKQ